MQPPPFIQDDKYDELVSALRTIPSRMNAEAVEKFTLLADLELWIRLIIYIELKSKYGDNYEEKVFSHFPQKVKEREKILENYRFYKYDKDISEFPSPETDVLSYLSLGDYLSLVKKEWECFEYFFEEKEKFREKFELVRLIRNRVAHLRNGPTLELKVLKSVLLELEPKIVQFCDEYNQNYVTISFEEKAWYCLWNKFTKLPFSDEHTREVIHYRPWKTFNNPDDYSGLIIEFILIIHPNERRNCNFPKFVEGIKSIHKDIIHITPSNNLRSVKIKLPLVLGDEKIGNCLEIILSSWINNLIEGKPEILNNHSALSHNSDFIRYCQNGPECILHPYHPVADRKPPDEPYIMYSGLSIFQE